MIVISVVKVVRISVELLWPPYGIGQAIIYCPVVSFFFSSSPNLSGRRVDVYDTSTYGVALVRI